MKLTGKLFAGLLSLAFVVSCIGGCAQPTSDETPAPAAGADEGSTTGPSGTSVPAPEGAETTE